MSRTLALLAIPALLALAGCAERRYPWPDFAVADDAWVPLPVPPRAPPPAPAFTPSVQSVPFGAAPASGWRS